MWYSSHTSLSHLTYTES